MRLLKGGGLAVALVAGAVGCTSAGSSSAAPGAKNAVTLVLQAKPLLSGQDVTAAEMSTTARVLRERLHAAGVTAVVSETGTTIRVSVDAASKARAARLVQPTGQLQFRQVLEAGAPSAPATTPPTGSAELSVAPDSEGPTAESVSAAFESLDCSSGSTPTTGPDLASDYLAVCDVGAGTNYLLAPAGVDMHVASAVPRLDTQMNVWLVDVQLDRSGAAAWLKLTARVAKLPMIGTGCAPPAGCNAVAIVLDGVVLSAPYIADPQGITGGVAQITGDFTQQAAAQLADVVKYGPLPVALTPVA